MFYIEPLVDSRAVTDDIVAQLNADYLFATFDPNKDISSVSLSPLGIVHLFRQFFFEFDSFLGTPVGHVWLSPGASVELIEISTRKTSPKRHRALPTETRRRPSRRARRQDELSEADQGRNKNDIKFGANADANQSWGSGAAPRPASFNLGRRHRKPHGKNTQAMRKQSDKLSTEIKQELQVDL